MKRICIITIILLLISSPALLGAAQKKSKKYLIKAAPTLTTPYDLSATSLSPFFTGHNIFNIMIDLIKNQKDFTRDEFENDVDFNDKLDKLKQKSLDVNLTYDSYYAFMLEDTSKVYDPNAMILKISKSLNDIHDYGLHSTLEKAAIKAGTYYGYRKPQSIALVKELSSSSRYIGQNAFGVKKPITKKIFETASLAFITDFNDGDARNWYTTEFFRPFKIDKERARIAKAEGSLLFICKLRYPFIGKGTMYKSPTIDDPEDITENISYLVVYPVAYVYYNLKTGEIYDRVEFKR